MRDMKLLEVTVVTDDETGIYAVGELDFGVPYSTQAWLDRGDNRERLADWLAELSGLCREGRAPFRGGGE